VHQINNIIHSTAFVNPKSILGKGIKIGPYSVIDGDVQIGDNCEIGSHVNINSNVTIGNDCKIFSSSSIGSDPQDLKYNGENTKLIIGNSTTIREFCTINRGTIDSNVTKIGNNTLLMAYVHVAHDCFVGDNVILANGVQLGGHVLVYDNVTIGGMTPVHQFCKLGEHSFVAGGYRVVQDVPPYILAQGEPLSYHGLNSIGLRRKGFNSDVRTLLKKAYSLIYKSDLNLTQAVNEIDNDLSHSKEVKNILNFIKKSNRGLI
tara:strand:+ start:515 stop:1297 length:783 start_codon:yes stop_codon:yes gene_type:complete